MGRKSKSHRQPAIIRSVLSQNVVVLRDRMYTTQIPETTRNKNLARDAQTTLSQVQRVITGELGTSVDIIERLATALRVRPQDLITPYFSPPPGILQPGEDLSESGVHRILR